MNIVRVSRKIVRPTLPPTILHRPLLVNLLREVLPEQRQLSDRSPYKLVLLCAPAGYGKTTLLVDFSLHSQRPCCWYFLDRSDMDTTIFVELLIISIRQMFPQFAPGLEHQMPRFLPGDENSGIREEDLMMLADAFSAAIENDIAEHFVLILCNYHEVHTNQNINLFMNRVLHYLPQKCTIVIESRANPALNLAPLLANRQLCGIGSNDLRFSSENIQNLMRTRHFSHFSDEELENLSRTFNGWIAGILLGTRLGDIQSLSSLSQAPSNWGAPAVRMDRQKLFGYIVEEVFKREPEMYRFLKEVSILPQMTPALCNELVGITNSAEHLTYLEQQGLFVSRLGDENDAFYICHPLLRELFSEELQQQDAAHARVLYRRAADLFYALKDYDQAISSAHAAGADDVAAHIIAEIAKSMLYHGHSETVARWITMLDPQVVEHDPHLLLLHANINLIHYQPLKALPILKRVQTLIENDIGEIDEDIRSITLAEVFVAESMIFFEKGEYQQVQHLCQQALTLLPADEREIRALTYQRLGACFSLLGDCLSGITQMQQALQLWGHNTEIRQTAQLHSYLANSYNLIGNYALAEHHRTRAITICDHLGDWRGKINNLVGMATTKRNKGLFKEAEVLLQEALQMAREKRFTNGEAYVLINLGEIYQDQNLLQDALKVIDESMKVTSQVHDNYLKNCVLCDLASTYLFMGDHTTALFFVDQVQVKTDGIASYESALCELTRGTILLFQGLYQEASVRLERVETYLQKTGVKHLHIRAVIRLAACQIGLGQQEKALELLRKATTMGAQSFHEHLIQVEVQRLPALSPLLPLLSTTDPVDLLQESDLPKLQRRKSSKEPVSVEEAQETELRIVAFGEPTVIVNNVPITRWRMARSMELCFFLIDHNRPIRKEKIIATLWPDADESIDQTLRSTIYYLRKTLGESCVLYSGGTYTLNLSSLYGERVYYDVSQFQQAYSEAKKALTEENDELARGLLEHAIKLYRGDYVQSFYSDWCIPRRDELRRMYLDAHHQLALICWHNEEFEEGMEHWQQILAVDSCQEEAHYGLMRCYIRLGKRGMALRQYQRCVEILQEELGIAPGATIQKLYQRLITNT